MNLSIVIVVAFEHSKHPPCPVSAKLVTCRLNTPTLANGMYAVVNDILKKGDIHRLRELRDDLTVKKQRSRF